MKSSRANLPAQVIDVRPRDEELYSKWKPKNKTVTPTDNGHLFFTKVKRINLQLSI